MRHRDVPAPHGVDHGPADRVLAAAGRTSRTELLAPADQPVGLLGVGQRRAEVVDDLVGVAGEPVERVHVRALPRREQQRREVVGLAVRGVELAAGLVRRAQRRVGMPAASSSRALTGRESSRCRRLWQPGAVDAAVPAPPGSAGRVALAAVAARRDASAHHPGGDRRRHPRRAHPGRRSGPVPPSPTGCPPSPRVAAARGPRGARAHRRRRAVPLRPGRRDVRQPRGRPAGAGPGLLPRVHGRDAGRGRPRGPPHRHLLHRAEYWTADHYDSFARITGAAR